MVEKYRWNATDWIRPLNIGRLYHILVPIRGIANFRPILIRNIVLPENCFLYYNVTPNEDSWECSRGDCDSATETINYRITKMARMSLCHLSCMHAWRASCTVNEELRSVVFQRSPSLTTYNYICKLRLKYSKTANLLVHCGSALSSDKCCWIQQGRSRFQLTVM